MARGVFLAKVGFHPAQRRTGIDALRSFLGCLNRFVSDDSDGTSFAAAVIKREFGGFFILTNGKTRNSTCFLTVYEKQPVPRVESNGVRQHLVVKKESVVNAD